MPKIPTKKEKKKSVTSPLSRVEQILLAHPDEISTWRIFKIMTEFVAGFELLKEYKQAATIFGSARKGLGDKLYEQASNLAFKLAKDGFTIITGGGPGIMEAANKGAKEAGGVSVGLNIKLPFEQVLNKYVTHTESFHYFFTRKVMLSLASKIYIFFPGGFGTMDELFEILTLIQTQKIPPTPVIIVNKEYWAPLLAWIDETMLKNNHCIDKDERALYTLVKDDKEAYKVIRDLLKA